MRIRHLQKILTTGDNPYINIGNLESVLLHYVEEVGELVKAVRKVKTYEELYEKCSQEIGDQLILLCFVSSALSIDLESATLNKIKKNIKEGKFKPELEEDLNE